MQTISHTQRGPQASSSWFDDLLRNSTQRQQQKPTGRRGAEKRWLPLEDQLLIYHSIYSYNCKQALARKVASGIPLSLSNPLVRTEDGISARLVHLKSRMIIPRNWYPGSGSYKPNKPFTLREDVEIVRWHVGGRLSLDPAVFLEQNRSGSEIRAREEVLSKDDRLVRKFNQLWRHLQNVTRWYDCWNKAQNGEEVPVNINEMPEEYPRTAEDLAHLRAEIHDKVKREVKLARGRLAT